VNSISLSRRTENWIIFILVAIQFTHIVDFVVIMPLGPKLFRAFKIDTTHFGLLVSAYTISAGVSGILASFFLDRFDRKKALIWLYFGFGISTLICALSGGFWPLLMARVMTGAFGGILTALALSVIGDYIPSERRGVAMGAVMSAFSIASVLGVPSGLWLAEKFDWHAPFFLLSLTTLPVLLLALRFLPALNLHLLQGNQQKPWQRIQSVLQLKGSRISILLMMTMMLAGFSVIPYISPFLVSNAGLREADLSLVYLAGGVFTFIAAIISGKLTDKFGTNTIFRIFGLLSIIPILLITNMEKSGLIYILFITTLFMALLSSRIVPVITLITSTVEPAQRGTFMSILSSFQQFSSGLAAYIAGLMVTETKGGMITGFDSVGIMAATFTLLAILLATWLKYHLMHAPHTSSSSPVPDLSID